MVLGPKIDIYWYFGLKRPNAFSAGPIFDPSFFEGAFGVLEGPGPLGPLRPQIQPEGVKMSPFDPFGHLLAKKPLFPHGLLKWASRGPLERAQNGPF